MPEMVYVNGEFYPAAEAKISVFDHGFLYGDGLFETMRVYNGEIFMLKEHLDRLYDSAEALALTIPWDRSELEAVLAESIRLNGDDLNIRLTMTRGTGPARLDPGLCKTPNMVVMAREIKIDERIYQEGTKALFVKTIRNLAGAVKPEIKSLNFLNNIFARQEVIKAGLDEGFMLNYAGQVTEGTVSNVFMVDNGVLKTPHLDSGLLPGITRHKVISLAQEVGLVVSEEFLYRDDFLQAEEIFYTNSISEIVPVIFLEKQMVGSGLPGKITRKLFREYKNCINTMLTK